MGCLGHRGRVQILETRTVSGKRYALSNYRLLYIDSSGGRQLLQREVCHRGDSVAVLLFCPARCSVILVKQLRVATFIRGDSNAFILEVPGGLVGVDSPEVAARKEVEEETGFRLSRLKRVCSTFLNPNVLTELVHLFVSEVGANDRVGAGGGISAEGEDMEVCELGLFDALERIKTGEIVDGKTILLLYYALSEIG